MYVGLVSAAAAQAEVLQGKPDQPRAATGAADGARTADGFGRLFNGRDLSGWTLQSGQIGSWRAEGGSLITSGDPKGWLFAEKEYSDFELRVEYKVSANANSGICIRAPGPDVAPGAQDPSFKGLEIQIIDDNASQGDSGDFATGSIWGIAAPSQRVTRPVGEWNAMDIVVRGRQVAVSINGTQVVDANLGDHAAKAERFPGLLRTSGFIGLQSYANQVEFRNVAIKSLSSAGADESAAQPAVPPAGPAPSATSPRVDRIEIIEKGIYQATGGKWVEDPKVATGKRYVGGTSITFTDHTTTIPARKVSFGFRYRIVGEPKGTPVTIKRVIIYPKGGLRNPKTGKTWFQDTVEIPGKKIGEAGYIGYNFGDIAHPTGTWTLQLWCQDRKLAEVAFTVVER
jgi:hypothetical protein